MARKQLTKAQRDLKNKLDRTRRFLEKNIIQAKKNGWALKQGMWFGKHSACLFGLVIANERGLGKGDDLSYEVSGTFGKHLEEQQAAMASGLKVDEVNLIIEGFETFGHYDPTSIQGKFHALGWRLAEKYVEKGKSK